MTCAWTLEAGVRGSALGVTEVGGASGGGAGCPHSTLSAPGCAGWWEPLPSSPGPCGASSVKIPKAIKWVHLILNVNLSRQLISWR